jgi:hypothetical protein
MGVKVILTSKTWGNIKYLSPNPLKIANNHILKWIIELSNINISNYIEKKQDIITGAASSIITYNVNPNKVLISSIGGKVGTSFVTTTELSYLEGATNNIQNQINNLIGFSSDTSNNLVNYINDNKQQHPYTKRNGAFVYPQQ